MILSKKKEKEIIIEEDPRASRFGFLNESDSKLNIKTDSTENINARLAVNSLVTQLIDLLNQRKMLILKKVERMFEQNSARIEMISKGRVQDLKNQAKLLRDESVSNLVDNSDRMNNTKNLLKRILEQHNFSQFETMQKVKGKKHYDRSKQVENDLNTKTKKYNILMDQLQKLHQKQRQMFSKIEERESQMIALLRRKENNYLRKAQQIQDDVQRFKTIIKQNKVSKDRKKKEIEALLTSIIDSLLAYQNQTLDRVVDIENLFGGQDLTDFDRFIRQIENLIDNKFDERKDDKKKKAVDQLLKIANGYDVYIQQLNKQRQAEIILLEDANEGFKNMVKIALIQKIYLQDISNDKGRLLETIKKCKTYKALLDTFEGDRVRLNKQLSRINHMKNLFAPKLKALTTEQIRKQQLKRQLGELVAYQSQIERYEKKYKEFEYMNNSYGLTRQTIERQMEEYASKGNLIEYKSKLGQMQKLQRQFQGQRQSLSAQQYQRLEYRLNVQVQNLYAKYADLIEAILIEGTELNSNMFLTKISKRLAII